MWVADSGECSGGRRRLRVPAPRRGGQVGVMAHRRTEDLLLAGGADGHRFWLGPIARCVLATNKGGLLENAYSSPRADWPVC